MNQLRIAIATLFLYGAHVDGEAQAVLPDDKGFRLVRQSGDVSIYERWIHFPKNQSAGRGKRGKRGVFYAQATIKEGFDLLRSEAKIQQWQSHVSKFKVVPTNGSSTWYEYSYHDIPWPVGRSGSFFGV